MERISISICFFFSSSQSNHGWRSTALSSTSSSFYSAVVFVHTDKVSVCHLRSLSRRPRHSEADVAAAAARDAPKTNQNPRISFYWMPFRADCEIPCLSVCLSSVSLPLNFPPFTSSSTTTCPPLSPPQLRPLTHIHQTKSQNSFASILITVS